MTLKEAFSAPNVLLASVNILIFIVLQSLFYYVVISGLFEATVKNKARAIKTYLQNAPGDQSFAICNAFQDVLRDNPIDKNRVRARKDHNIHLIAYDIALPFAICALVVAILAAIVCARKGSWTRAHWWSCLVLCASFIVEVYVYFAVIRQVVIIGDVETLSDFVSWTDDWVPGPDPQETTED